MGMWVFAVLLDEAVDTVHDPRYFFGMGWIWWGLQLSKCWWKYLSKRLGRRIAASTEGECSSEGMCAHRCLALTESSLDLGLKCGVNKPSRVVADVLANWWLNVILISKVHHQTNVARFALMCYFYHLRTERFFSWHCGCAKLPRACLKLKCFVCVCAGWCCP